MKTICAIAAISLMTAISSVYAGDYMKAFPAAEEGMVRYVLNLPQQEDESTFRVEIIVGKTVELDKVNRFFFAGKIEAERIEGWGFTRYTVKKLGPMAGTRIGVGPDAPKADRFVKLGGEPYLVRYNSRLPVVVYVPEEAEVHYRIWEAEPESQPMDKG